MDQTSNTAAVLVPLLASVGLVGLIGVPALAIRSTRNAICPERARREALEAQRRAQMGQPVAAAFVIAPRRGEATLTETRPGASEVLVSPAR